LYTTVPKIFPALNHVEKWHFDEVVDVSIEERMMGHFKESRINLTLKDGAMVPLLRMFFTYVDHEFLADRIRSILSRTAV
jgi:hypothetical protein